MVDYRDLLTSSRGLQPYVIITPSRIFKIYGQPLTIYSRASALVFHNPYDAVRSVYIIINLPEIDMGAFLWVWCYLNAIPSPKVLAFSQLVFAYPILKMFGISVHSDIVNTWVEEITTSSHVRTYAGKDVEDTLINAAIEIGPLAPKSCKPVPSTFVVSAFDSRILSLLDPQRRQVVKIPSLVNLMPKVREEDEDRTTGYIQFSVNGETFLSTINAAFMRGTMDVDPIFPLQAEELDELFMDFGMPRGYSLLIPKSLKKMIIESSDLIFITMINSHPDLPRDAVIRIDKIWYAVTTLGNRVVPGTMLSYVLQYTTGKSLYTLARDIRAMNRHISSTYRPSAVDLLVSIPPIIHSISIYVGRSKTLVNLQPLVGRMQSSYIDVLMKTNEDFPTVLAEDNISIEAVRYVFSKINGMECEVGSQLSFHTMLEIWNLSSYMGVSLESKFGSNMIADILASSSPREYSEVLRLIKSIPMKSRERMNVFDKSKEKLSIVDTYLSVLGNYAPRDIILTNSMNGWKAVSDGIQDGRTSSKDILIVWDIKGFDGKTILYQESKRCVYPIPANLGYSIHGWEPNVKYFDEKTMEHNYRRGITPIGTYALNDASKPLSLRFYEDGTVKSGSPGTNQISITGTYVGTIYRKPK